MNDAAARYLELSPLEANAQLRRLAERPPAGIGRQESFLPVETLLCFGLFFIFDPRSYGGANIDKMPRIAHRLAALFRRSAGSVLYKMGNLVGSRPNGAKAEPRLFAVLSAQPDVYRDIYVTILREARALGISETALPDFLGCLQADATSAGAAMLLGQDELPLTDSELLKDPEQQDIEVLVSALGEVTTEKLVVGRVRLAQHRFAAQVLANWQQACAFCGFSPVSLPTRHGLLRASHIKPWARSTARERVDSRNGLAACPLHDAAFDRGYITVLPDHRIVRAAILDQSIQSEDPHSSLFFRDIMRERITSPSSSAHPRSEYLTYHRRRIFVG